MHLTRRPARLQHELTFKVKGSTPFQVRLLAAGGARAVCRSERSTRRLRCSPLLSPPTGLVRCLVQKIFNAYCQKTQQDQELLRFVFDQQRLRPEVRRSRGHGARSAILLFESPAEPPPTPGARLPRLPLLMQQTPGQLEMEDGDIVSGGRAGRSRGGGLRCHARHGRPPVLLRPF